MNSNYSIYWIVVLTSRIVISTIFLFRKKIYQQGNIKILYIGGNQFSCWNDFCSPWGQGRFGKQVFGLFLHTSSKQLCLMLSKLIFRFLKWPDRVILWPLFYSGFKFGSENTRFLGSSRCERNFFAKAEAKTPLFTKKFWFWPVTSLKVTETKRPRVFWSESVPRVK